MIDLVGEANSAALIGLIGGIVLGLAARLGRFCTLGAVEDYLYSSDDRFVRNFGSTQSLFFLHHNGWSAEFTRIDSLEHD